MDNSNLEKAEKVLWIILALNWFVAVIKIYFGVVSGALSVSADGVHAFFDGLSNILGVAGIRFARRPADTKYPYGYQKYIELTAFIILFFLMMAIWEFSGRIYQRFIGSLQPEVTLLMLGVLAATLFIDYFVAKYEYSKGKKLQNNFLIADSFHTRSHLFITSAVILGMAAAKWGYSFLSPVVGPEPAVWILKVLDPIIASGIIVLILGLAYEIFKETSSVLVDKAQIRPEEIEEVIKGISGVISVHRIRTRGSKNGVYLDMHLVVPVDLSIKEAHQVCEDVEKKLRRDFPNLKDIVIHPEEDVKDKECSCK